MNDTDDIKGFFAKRPFLQDSMLSEDERSALRDGIPLRLASRRASQLRCFIAGWLYCREGRYEAAAVFWARGQA